MVLLSLLKLWVQCLTNSIGGTLILVLHFLYLFCFYFLYLFFHVINSLFPLHIINGFLIYFITKSQWDLIFILKSLDTLKWFFLWVVLVTLEQSWALSSYTIYKVFWFWIYNWHFKLGDELERYCFILQAEA